MAPRTKGQKGTRPRDLKRPKAAALAFTPGFAMPADETLHDEDIHIEPIIRIDIRAEDPMVGYSGECHWPLTRANGEPDYAAEPIVAVGCQEHALSWWRRNGATVITKNASRFIADDEGPWNDAMHEWGTDYRTANQNRRAAFYANLTKFLDAVEHAVDGARDILKVMGPHAPTTPGRMRKR